MNTNASGHQSLSLMSDFDKLPRLVRRALADSDHNWASSVVLKELRRRKKGTRILRNAAHAVHEIQRWDDDKNYADYLQGIVPRKQRPQHPPVTYVRQSRPRLP